LLSAICQLALAATRANAFIRYLLTHPAVRDCIAAEGSIWSVVSECALLISKHGMSEDRHLCLFAGGCEGLLRFCQCCLMSEEAETACMHHVSSLIKKSANQECSTEEIKHAMLLNDSFIYDFPRLTSIFQVA
jgi:hypothetical protein